MFPDDYKNDFDWDSGGYFGEDKLQHFDLIAITDEMVCPYCGGTNIHRNGSYLKKGFKDITSEEEMVVLSFKLRRYICEDCSAKKTAETGKESYVSFSSKLPKCIPENDKVSVHVVDSIVKKVAKDRISVSQAAKHFKVAQSSASEQIEERRKMAEQCFESWMPCDAVLVYPFCYPSVVSEGSQKKYVSLERCAILGVVEKYAMLYAILDNCKETTILEQLRKIPFDGDSIPVMFLTDYPRPILHKEVPKIYPDIELGIERSFSFTRMERLRQEIRSSDLDWDLLALKRIFAIHCYDPISDEFMPIDMDTLFLPISNEGEVDSALERYTDHSLEEIAKGTFEQMYTRWKENCSSASLEFLSEVCKEIENNTDSVVNGLFYAKAQYDPARLLNFIAAGYDRNIPFKDLFSWLALIADVHNTEMVTAVQMLCSDFIPRPIHRFCIDLNRLNEIFDKEFSL